MSLYPSPLAHESHLFGDAGWCPNNPACPLIIYRTAHTAAPEALARWFENRFGDNGWPPSWRYTIYDFPHFHSNTHEVIGAYRGRALVVFGDKAGQAIEISAGDVVIIPAGVSHQCIDASLDFHAVGAYPAGYSPDQIRPEDPPGPWKENISSVPLPLLDPLHGQEGAILHEWKSSSPC